MTTSAGTTQASRRRGRGRRPADEVRAEVLASAAEILLADGAAAVTFERVAARAGASKTTLYKWWDTPGALAAEAYFERVQATLSFRDTGDLAADLAAQMRAFAGLMTTARAGMAARELIGLGQSDPALRRSIATSYARPRRALAVERLRTAQRAGELRDDAPLEAMVDQLWGACYHRMLLLDEPITDELIDTLIDTVLHGAAAR